MNIGLTTAEMPEYFDFIIVGGMIYFVPSFNPQYPSNPHSLWCSRYFWGLSRPSSRNICLFAVCPVAGDWPEYDWQCVQIKTHRESQSVQPHSGKLCRKLGPAAYKLYVYHDATEGS